MKSLEVNKLAIESDLQVAAIQMVSGTAVKENLNTAAYWISNAAKNGAKLVVLPEYFCLFGQNDTDKVGIKEEFGSGQIQDFLADQAKQHGIWLAGGSLPLKSPDEDRIYNTTLVYDPTGEVCCRYDKVHLFGFSRNGESYDESVTIRPGDNAPQSFETPFGRVAVGICYDLRFPEFFRALKPVDLIILPAAFTYTTGSAHWETLLKARAIENQCYVLASAQGGKHANGRRTWGHSMLVGPWGDVLDSLPENAGLVEGTISTAKITKVRESLPALRHRVM